MKGVPTVRGQGWSLAFSARSREAGDNYHAPRQARRRADRVRIRGRLVRISAGNRSAVSPANRKRTCQRPRRAGCSVGGHGFGV